MGRITILPETTKNPITLIGKRAGICQGGDVLNNKKNYDRGLECILSNHGRAFEYVNVEIVIERYSSRVIREWYTHIGGSPTRLQESTRYMNYSDFDYTVPYSISKNANACDIYNRTINHIKASMKELKELSVPNEDITMLLPLAYTTKIVDKRNLRNYIDMSRVRECSRSYIEFCKLFTDIRNALKEYSEEWEWIINNLFHPKCDEYGYCTEKQSCGRYPKEKGYKR